MDNVFQALLNEAVDLHRAGDLTGAANRYNQLLNNDPFNAGILFLMGDIAVRQGANGVAINLLSNSVSVKPHAEAYVALGCAYRAENMYEQACAAWDRAIALEPSSAAYNNLASVYSDHGRPEKALGYVSQALKLEPESPNAKWNRALALLTQQRWPEAWRDHEHRFDARVQTVSTRRNLGCPVWDGKTPGLRIAVHGEQGVGDEVMFLSMLQDLIAMHKEVVVEVEPRLMDLVERSFGVATYGNEAAMRAHEAPFDAVVPLGSLGMTFRQADEHFPGTPYLKPDPERVAYWRKRFCQEGGKKPIIGVAWQGGAKETRIQQRSINAKALDFCKRGTAVSLQYGPHAEAEARKNGFLFFPESTGGDLDEQAAMVAACDAIVTVAQTLVHLGGAIGIPTHVLTPLYSSWRYGQKDKMVWYGSVQLHRQLKDGDWGHPLAEAKKAIDKLCRESTKC
jgi:tetratricopeptide (TPR) repeat protein